MGKTKTFKPWQITPWLFVSRDTNGYTDESKKRFFAENNITRVVCMTKRTTDEYVRTHPTIKWVPLRINDTEVTPEVELQLNDEVFRILKEHWTGGATLVHCYGGRNRSMLLAAMCLKADQGMTGLQAVEELRRARPEALINEKFYAFLST